MKQGQGELKREGIGGNEIMGITACVRQHVRGSMSGLQTTVKIHARGQQSPLAPPSSCPPSSSPLSTSPQTCEGLPLL